MFSSSDLNVNQNVDPKFHCRFAERMLQRISRWVKWFLSIGFERCHLLPLTRLSIPHSTCPTFSSSQLKWERISLKSIKCLNQLKFFHSFHRPLSVYRKDDDDSSTETDLATNIFGDHVSRLVFNASEEVDQPVTLLIKSVKNLYIVSDPTKVHESVTMPNVQKPPKKNRRSKNRRNNNK